MKMLIIKYNNRILVFMKFLIYLIIMLIHLKPTIAEPTIFSQWDQVAVVEIINGKANIFLLHCSDNIKIDDRSFKEEVNKFSQNLKDMTFVYAMVIQEGKQKSSTWEISKNTFLELKKIMIIIRDAKVKPPIEELRK